MTISTFLLDSEEARRWFTPGLLRDVVVQVVLALPDETAGLEALVGQVTDKLLHQVQSADVARGLAAACTGLPGADTAVDAVAALIGPGDRLRPLV